MVFKDATLLVYRIILIPQVEKVSHHLAICKWTFGLFIGNISLQLIEPLYGAEIWFFVVVFFHMLK